MRVTRQTGGIATPSALQFFRAAFDRTVPLDHRSPTSGPEERLAPASSGIPAFLWQLLDAVAAWLAAGGLPGGRSHRNPPTALVDAADKVLPRCCQDVRSVERGSRGRHDPLQPWCMQSPASSANALLDNA
jgi:hypothetical protein